MENPKKRNYDSRSKMQRHADFISTDELLMKQTMGKVPLTREEKIRLQKYEKQKRNERKNK